MYLRYKSIHAKQLFINEQAENEKNKLVLEQNLLKLEQKALFAQMNPHFIFNSLNTIHSYYSLGDSKKGSAYLVSFSQLLRRILETSSKEFISLEKEKELMLQYAELFNIKLEQKFDFDFNIEDNIDEFETLIPSMIIQPFIENAILHGINHIQHKGKISVFVKAHTINSITISIKDNGVGRFHQKNKNDAVKPQSMGLDITQKRISNINKNADIDSRIEFHDLEDDISSTGTLVTFNLFCKFIE